MKLHSIPQSLAPTAKVSKQKSEDGILLFLCILPFLFSLMFVQILYNATLCQHVLVLYKYFYFVENPFNLYIPFLLNPQENFRYISAAHICFPLEQIVMKKQQFPLMGQYVSRTQTPLCYVFGLYYKLHWKCQKSLPTQQFYKVSIQLLLNISCCQELT